MKMLQRYALGLVIGSLLAFRLSPVQTPTASTPALPLPNDLWVATDALGRTMPAANATGLPRAKHVGIFYFLWHGAYTKGEPVYDISRALRANISKPPFGSEAKFHWWGEPEVGYYCADDPWIIRHHLQMLVNAGVDFLFFDVSNADTYLTTLRKLCEVSTLMRKQGIPTPSITFLTYTKTAETVNKLYTAFYAPRQYEDLWFRWQGKPLILAKQSEITDPAQRDFFTYRYSWAWTDSRVASREWQWIDDTPQDYGWDINSTIPEQIPVAVAGHPIRNIGKSYAHQKQPSVDKQRITPYTKQGRYFAEQWNRALSVNPQLIMVTGWNEWIAQRFVARPDAQGNVTDFLGRKARVGESFFVDLYNEEYNRDIEPMSGGYGDAYYYQLVANVRRFKGLNAIPVSKSRSGMVVDGRFAEWSGVTPNYRDWTGDVAHRNWIGADGKTRYTNTTGRNDIVAARAAFDERQVYFWVKTERPITKPTGSNWMLLLIDTDGQPKTGWQGYDLVINRTVHSPTQTTVHRWQQGRWQLAGQVNYRMAGNQLELALPRALFGRASPRFDFHWVDNATISAGLPLLYNNGDNAPDRRFNYRFIGK